MGKSKTQDSRYDGEIIIFPGDNCSSSRPLCFPLLMTGVFLFTIECHAKPFFIIGCGVNTESVISDYYSFLLDLFAHHEHPRIPG